MGLFGKKNQQSADEDKRRCDACGKLFPKDEVVVFDMAGTVGHLGPKALCEGCKVGYLLKLMGR